LHSSKPASAQTRFGAVVPYPESVSKKDAPALGGSQWRARVTWEGVSSSTKAPCGERAIMRFRLGEPGAPGAGTFRMRESGRAAGALAAAGFRSRVRGEAVGGKQVTIFATCFGVVSSVPRLRVQLLVKHLAAGGGRLAERRVGLGARAAVEVGMAEPLRSSL
jgi:hypothetical protein